MAAEPWHSRLEKMAARRARARKARQMSDQYAKASGRSVPEISRDGTSMSRAARDSARLSGDDGPVGFEEVGEGLIPVDAHHDRAEG